MIISILLVLQLLQTPLFEENFSFGYSHDWLVCDPVPAENGPSNWCVKDGVLYQEKDVFRKVENGTGAARLGTRFLLSDQAMSDGTIVARISSQDDGGIAVLFRVLDADHYYRLFLIRDKASGGPLARIEKRSNGSIEVLGESRSPLTYPFGLWWNLSIEMKGSRFVALMNGEPLLDAADSDYKSGGLGIESWANNGVRVDSIAFFGEEASELRLAPKPALLKGPFIWCMTPTGFKITWETSIPLDTKVELHENGETRLIDAGRGKSLFHEASISGLKPGEAIGYRIISGPVVSPVYKTRTPQKNRRRLRFCAYGDNRSYPDAHRLVITSMVSKAPEFIINAGDLTTDGRRYEGWLREFFAPADPLIHTVPFYTCLGNHENDSRWYYDFMALPGNEKYYWFTQGNAFFVSLDSTRSLVEGSEQSKWLVKTLITQEARTARWKFCFFHHPPYCEGKVNYLSPVGIKENVLPLLEKAKFDILFLGHTHNYERGKLNGLYHVVTGGGGAPLVFGKHYKVREVPHAMVTRCQYHACLVEIVDNNLRFSAFTPDGKTFDSFEITK